MYGLLLENTLFFLKKIASEPRYLEIVVATGLLSDSEGTGKDLAINITFTYPEAIIPRVVKKASIILGISEVDIMEGVGGAFPKYSATLGVEKTLNSIGRKFREFISNLDNVHDYIKLDFPKMRAPSFFVESEDPSGLTLLYRSKRRGYAYYVLGQMKEIARLVFGINNLEVKVLEQKVNFDTIHVKYRLNFDNNDYTVAMTSHSKLQESSMPFKAQVLFHLFPFSILFTEDLRISLIGEALRRILPHVIGKQMLDCFTLIRPLIEFTLEEIMARTNNVFVFGIQAKLERSRRFENIELVTGQPGQEDTRSLQLKGQVVYVSEWRRVLFLGSPIIHSLQTLKDNGLCITDLSLNDGSADYLVVESQKLIEANLVDHLNKQSSEAIASLDAKHQRLALENDNLSSSLVPREMAPPIRKGEVLLHRGPPPSGMRQFKVATVVMAKVAHLDEICAGVGPKGGLALVRLLDNVCSIFDHLAQTHNLISLQMAGDCVAAFGLDSATGVKAEPEGPGHHERAATMAIDLKMSAADQSTWALRDPSKARRARIQFCIGLHTGPLDGITVGHPMPRFSLVGDTSKTAEALMSTCPAGRILMSKATKDLLSHKFRYSSGQALQQTSRDNNLKPEDVFVLASKDDHAKPSVSSILRAYAKFKHAKAKHNDQGLFLASQHPIVKDLQGGVKVASSSGGFCGGFKVDKSKVCTIL